MGRSGVTGSLVVFSPKPWCSSNMDGCGKKGGGQNCREEQMWWGKRSEEGVRKAEGMWNVNVRERGGHLQLWSQRFLWLENRVFERWKAETLKTGVGAVHKAVRWVSLNGLGWNGKSKTISTWLTGSGDVLVDAEVSEARDCDRNDARERNEELAWSHRVSIFVIYF